MTKEELLGMGIPTMFGEPLYPDGAPVPSDRYYVDGKSMRELYFLYCDEVRDPQHMFHLKEYVIYYLHAPVWKGTEEVLRQDLGKFTLNQLIDACMELGLDPF